VSILLNDAGFDEKRDEVLEFQKLLRLIDGNVLDVK